MADPRIKTLKIKTGVVKRLTKEKLMYIQEKDQQEEKVERLRKAGELNDNYILFLFDSNLGTIEYLVNIIYGTTLYNLY